MHCVGELEDSMESFFLSETTKYLFLLFANTTDLPNHYIFTTEGHLLPPFPVQDHPATLPTALQAQPAGPVAASTAASAASETASAAASVAPSQSRFEAFWRKWLPGHGWKIVPEKIAHKPSAASGHSTFNAAAWEVAAEKCEQLCGRVSEEESALRRQELQAALPLVSIEAGDAILLR